MNEKKSCIYFNINSYLHIYPFLLPFACTFTHFFQKIMCDEFKPDDSYKLLKYNIPYLFYYFLPKILSIFFMKYIKNKVKDEADELGQNTLSRRYHFLIKNENNKKIFLLIFIISFLEVAFKTGDTLLYYLQKIGDIHYLIEKRVAFIIFVPLFSFFILNKKLYRHHWVALIISLIGFIFFSVFRFILNYSYINEYKYHLLNILFSIFFSLALVIIKYLFTKYLILSPYTFLFYDGIFCIINLFIMLIIEYPIVINLNDKKNKDNNNYFTNNFLGIFTIFSGQTWKFYISLILSFFCSFGYFIFNALTLYNFSPYINVLTDCITPFLYDVFNFFFLDPDNSENNIKRYIYELVGYLIIIFGAFILNEFIILNFWGLNENTYSKICYRGRLDYNSFDDLTPNESEETFNNTSTNNEVEIEPQSSSKTLNL